MARMDPKVRDNRANLEQLASLIPQTSPTSVQIAAARVFWLVPSRGPQLRRVTRELQYQFEGRWLLARVVWRTEDDGPPIIEDMLLQPLPASLEEINRFTLDGKGIVHYGVLALAMALPVFSLAVLAVCLATPMPVRRKVLWSLAILIGVTTIHFSWTTGAFAIDNPLSFRLLSAGYARHGLGPWIFSLSFPLGAVLFLLWRPVIRGSAPAGELAPDAPGP